MTNVDLERLNTYTEDEEEEFEVRRSYVVTIDELRQHTYYIEDMNSPEEAEVVAEEWFEDGEEGEVSNSEVLSVDSYPASKEETN